MVKAILDSALSGKSISLLKQKRGNVCRIMLGKQKQEFVVCLFLLFYKNIQANLTYILKLLYGGFFFSILDQSLSNLVSIPLNVQS